MATRLAAQAAAAITSSSGKPEFEGALWNNNTVSMVRCAGVLGRWPAHQLTWDKAKWFGGA